MIFPMTQCREHFIHIHILHIYAYESRYFVHNESQQQSFYSFTSISM